MAASFKFSPALRNHFLAPSSQGSLLTAFTGLRFLWHEKKNKNAHCGPLNVLPTCRTNIPFLRLLLKGNLEAIRALPTKATLDDFFSDLVSLSSPLPMENSSAFHLQ